MARFLAAELISAIFDDIDDIVRASHVDSTWRAIALNHPRYWRQACLSSLSAAALDFFHARLACGAGRECELRLQLAGKGVSAASFAEKVQPALCATVRRASRLEIWMDDSFAAAVFRCLAALPAPRVRIVILVMEPVDGGGRLVGEGVPAGLWLPDDLFGGQDCPVLESLDLMDVPLRPTPPRALRHVTVLGVVRKLSARAALPVRWLRDMPRLARLILIGPDERMLAAADGADAADWPAWLAPVRHLELRFADGTAADRLLAAAGCAAPHVTLDLHVPAAARRLLAALPPGPLALVVRCGAQYALEYAPADAAAVDGPRRTFSSWSTALPRLLDAPLYAHFAYFAPDVAGRVTVLRLTTAALDIVLLMPVMPAVVRLVLDVAGAAPIVCPPFPLRLPMLETVELDIAAPHSLWQLANFLETGIEVAPPRSLRDVRFAHTGAAYLRSEPSSLSWQLVSFVMNALPPRQ